MSRVKIFSATIALTSALIAGGYFFLDKDIESISAVELHQQIDSPDWVVIDIRNDEYFNGWPVKDGIKSGHIPGAVNIQSHVLDLAGNPDQQLALLAEKGITPDKKIGLFRDICG